MNRSKALFAALCLCVLAIPAGDAFSATRRHAKAAPKTAAPVVAPLRDTCCRIPAGAQVTVELVDQIGTRTQKVGDTFALRLASPVLVDGRVVIRAGSPGIGEVIESTGPGMGGKGAKMVLAARELTVNGRSIPLQGLQLAAMDKGNVNAANAIGISGLVLGPIGFVGLAVQGGHVVFPAGTQAKAKISNAMTLPSLGPATRSELALARSTDPRNAPYIESWVNVGPPPVGYGQVVFFRPKSLMGTGQWFNVRETGKALGKLTNGAYFVQTTEPGVHTYTASSEPQFKDRLNLQVDAGETYFVEGIMTHGVVIGAAALSPSNKAAFAKASKDLKPAPPPEPEKTDKAPAPAASSAEPTASTAEPVR